LNDDQSRLFGFQKYFLKL